MNSKNMKVKEDKGLTFDIENEGVSTIKEDSSEYYTDTFEPGQTKQRLKVGREVEGETTSGGGVKVLKFSRLSSVGTGIQSFTGFGFTPVSYTITSGTSGGSICQGVFDGISETGIYSNNYSGYDTGIAGRVIHLRDGSSTKTYATHESFIDDGLELNFSESNLTSSIIITAYS